MKRITLLLFAFLFISNFLNGQDLHAPAEIFKIMEDSDLSYQLGTLETEISESDESMNLVHYRYYRKYEEDGRGFSTMGYEISETAEKNLEEAEKHFKKREFKEAREFYQKVLEEHSEVTKMMTYIGQTYMLESRDSETAAIWYKKAIKANYIDYMAHWFLADIYIRNGEKKKALDEITVAHILNRNNPRIMTSLKNIYKANGVSYQEWNFTPQHEISEIGEGEVSIKFTTEWMFYTLPKAVWLFEPGYKESMGIDADEPFSMLEEKECLINWYAGNAKKLKKMRKSNPSFRALHYAIDNKQMDEYIIYEIALRKYPMIGNNLPKELVESIKEYILGSRTKKK